MTRIPPHLMTLADLTAPQISRIVNHAHMQKRVCLPWQEPLVRGTNTSKMRLPSQSLYNKSIALLFSKRSTRTRVAAETAATFLGGRAIFLGRDDIQIGVNETYRDSARVIGGMCQGIFARVGAHEEIEVSALSSLDDIDGELFVGIGEIFSGARHECALLSVASHAGSSRPVNITRERPSISNQPKSSENRQGIQDISPTYFASTDNRICRRSRERPQRHACHVPSTRPQDAHRISKSLSV